jgi:hypothetical protein
LKNALKPPEIIEVQNFGHAKKANFGPEIICIKFNGLLIFLDVGAGLEHAVVN